jgi:hypothetical protein
MARYRIVCASYVGEGDHRHVDVVSIETRSNPWPVREVRERLAVGDEFFGVTLSGEPVIVRTHDCWCGVATVRLQGGPEEAFPLAELNRCPA